MDWFTALQPPVQSGIITASVSFLSALIGAGVALFGTRLGSKRREVREDIAARRETRIQVYGPFLVGLWTAFRKLHELNYHLSERRPGIDWPESIASIKKLLGELELDSGRLDIVAGRKTAWDAGDIVFHMQGMFEAQSIPTTWRRLTNTSSNDEKIRDLGSRIDELTVTFRRELGLPEDE